MQSEHINDLAAALVKAQAAMKPAIKDATNPHFKSKYADLAAIWDACRDALTSNGLSVVQMPTDSAEPNRVALVTMLLHTSGQYLSTTVSTKLTQETAQGVGSALTYLRRYALAAMVGIVADEDDDGNAASQPRQQEQRATSYNGNGAKASEKQIKMLFAIWNKGGFDGTLQEWIASAYQCPIDELTMKQASEAIETLQQPA